MLQKPRHQCLIYKGSSSEQLPALAAIIKQNLDENYRCLYLNSPAMVSGIRASLVALGVDVMNEIITGRLALESESTLQADGTFDVDLMIHRIEDTIERSLDEGYKGLFATGDMTWEFGNRENLGKLLEYEWRLEELFGRRPELCGICQYHCDTLPPDVLRQSIVSHPVIFVNETLSRINPHFVQSRVLAEKRSMDTELDEIILQLCQSADV